MTSASGEVTLTTLSERLDDLTDLFKRRLLDDRAKQAVIDDLQVRLTAAEKALSAAALKPVVDNLALAIDRIGHAEPTADLRDSIAEELEAVIESLGVLSIAPGVGEPVDRLRHEVISASGSGPELCVAELNQAGYEKSGVVLRAARVTAVWSDPAGSSDEPA